MATILTMNPQKITVPADTNEYELDFSQVVEVGRNGTALFKTISGTSVQINTSGATITSDTGALTSTIDQLLLPIKKGVNIKYKGGAGSEVYQVSILPD